MHELNFFSLQLRISEVATVSILNATVIAGANMAYVNNNTTLELSCESTLAAPVYSWYRDGLDLNVSTALLVRTLLAEDGAGDYWCSDGSVSENKVTIKTFSMITYITACAFFVHRLFDVLRYFLCILWRPNLHGNISAGAI